MSRIAGNTGMAVLLAMAALFTGAGHARAQLVGSELYVARTCIACHGKDAKTPLLPDYPKLAGQNKDYAYKQMLDIKSGARNNGNTAAMKGVMHLASDEELQAIALWLSTLK